MIKAILFDCFGVLAHANLWHKFLAELTDDLQINKVKELNQQCDAGAISREDFFAGVYGVTGKHLKDVESLSGVEGLKNTQLVEYIRNLKNRNYKLGILSNIGSNWITDEFLDKEEQDLFDTFVFSFEVGVTKPSPDIYKVACEKLGLEPYEVVFTDDIEDYCIAAESIGITSIHYQNLPQLKTDLEHILNQE